jgi:hypothetical protein
LIRWKMFETYLEDVDEAVEQIRNNRYSSVIEHLGGNVYLTVDNNDTTDCSECARDTPSRNRVRWDYIHHNI